ncbi:MAG: hypothetical protein ABIO70_15825 [Pseudomonadota bacterium]
MKPLHLLLLSALLASGCRPPPAPVELDELCAYLFGHFEDESPREMQAGLANLDTWMQAHLEDTLEGYEVTNLSDAMVDVLDERNHNTADMLGAAVGVLIEGYDPYALGIAMSVEDQLEVIPGAHTDYTRTYLSDEVCWAEVDCEFLRTTNHLEDNYPLLGDVISENWADFRWVELETGLAMVQRSGLRQPSEVMGMDSFALNDEYYLNVMLPHGQGGGLTLQSMWVDATLNDDSVPESLALNLVINQMQAIYGDIVDFLDTHGAAVQPGGCAAVPARRGLALSALLGLLGLAAARRRRG